MELLKNFKLNDHEEVRRVVHHHPIVIVPHLVVSFLILILDFFLMYFLFLQGWWGAALFFAVIFVVAFYTLRIFFLYKRNRFVITNQRIVDYEQAGFFEKFVNELDLDNIQDIETKVRGIFPTIFGYGSLRIKLKNDIAPIELYKLKKPKKLQELIITTMNRTSDTIKEKRVSDDPLRLILAETKMLSTEQKYELMERVGQQIDDHEPKQVEETGFTHKSL
jgi:hypothetical protein